MSSKNQIQIRNSEGDTALLILLSIFAYEDFDVLSKTIIDSIDNNSAAKTKENVLNNILSKDKRFSVTNTYKKTITVTAVRNEDSYGNLITKPISSQLKLIAELQSKLDKLITVDDIGSDNSARDLDLFFKKLDTMTESDSDGNIFDNYKKLKGGKSHEESEDPNDKLDTKEKDTKVDPFEDPKPSSSEDENSSSNNDGKGSDKSKNKTIDSGEKGDSDEVETDGPDSVPLSDSKIKDNSKKEDIMKDNIPFYTASLEDIKSKEFKNNSGDVKINKDSQLGDSKTSVALKKDSDDKNAIIKDALPFTEFNVQQATDNINGTTSDTKASKIPDGKGKDKQDPEEVVDIIIDDNKKKKKEEE